MAKSKGTSKMSHNKKKKNVKSTIGAASRNINEAYYIQLNNDLRNAKPTSDDEEMWKKVKQILVKAADISDKRAEVIHSRMDAVTETLQALKPKEIYPWTNTKLSTDRIEMITEEVMKADPRPMEIYLDLESMCTEVSKQGVGYRFWGNLLIKKLITSSALRSALLELLVPLGIEHPSWQILIHLFYFSFDMDWGLYEDVNEYLTGEPMKNITLRLHVSSMISTAQVCFKTPPMGLTLAIQDILTAYKLQDFMPELHTISTYDEYNHFCRKLPLIKMTIRTVYAIKQAIIEKTPTAS